MQLDLQVTASASYARTLIERGCPGSLAQAAADILAEAEGQRELTPSEKITVEQAWAVIYQRHFS